MKLAPTLLEPLLAALNQGVLEHPEQNKHPILAPHCLKNGQKQAPKNWTSSKKAILKVCPTTIGVKTHPFENAQN
jgi:hypothetical protein